jgi:GT2 family glycosyltransferase
MTPMAVAIVNYNTRDHLRACLATVTAAAPSTIVVIDNASSDGSSEMVRTEFPNVVLRANTTNLGYGSAANQAVAMCREPYVLLLNADTRLLPGALHALSTYLDKHPRAALAGPRLVNADGSLQPSCYPFPTPLVLLFQESGLERLLRHVPLVGRRYLRTWSHSQPRSVPWVLGAALALRRVAFEAVGGFDPTFFLYNEEVDLCRRLQVLGWQIDFAPVASVAHVGGASTSLHRADMKVQYWRSTLQLYRRYCRTSDTVLLVLIMKSMALIRIVRDHLRLRRSCPGADRARLVDDISAWQRLLASPWSR